MVGRYEGFVVLVYYDLVKQSETFTWRKNYYTVQKFYNRRCSEQIGE